MEKETKQKDPETDIPEHPEQKNPFDIDTQTTNEIVFECGRHGLPKKHAIKLLRKKLSDQDIFILNEDLDNEESLASQSYDDGVARGEAEMTASLRQSTIDSKKDSYKSMTANEQKRVINDSLRKNFGIGE